MSILHQKLRTRGQHEYEGYDHTDASGNGNVDPYAVPPGVYTGVESGFCFRSQLGLLLKIFLDTNTDSVYAPFQSVRLPEGGLQPAHPSVSARVTFDQGSSPTCMLR